MAVVNLNNEKEQIVFGKDNVVISKYISGIKGGRALNVTTFTDKVIKAGHIIIKNAAGDYLPMPVSDGAYSALPDGCSYVGVLVSSILAAKPAAAIMTRGEVNEVASPYPVASIKSAFLAACPHIAFVSDNQ